MQFRFHVHSLA
jgi:hypothetical protein